MSASAWLMISADTVINRCSWDGDPETWAPPDDVEMLPDPGGVGVGWTRQADGSFKAPESPPQPVPASVSETQFMRAATRLGWVTGEDAEAYLARGVIPAFVASVVDQLPAAERTDKRLKVIGANTFERDDPVFALLIDSGIATAEQVDGLFQLADTLA